MLRNVSPEELPGGLSELARNLLLEQGRREIAEAGTAIPESPLLTLPRCFDGLSLEGVGAPGRQLKFVSWRQPLRVLQTAERSLVRLASAHASLYLDELGQIWDVEDDATFEEDDPALVARSVVSLLEQEAARWQASQLSDAVRVPLRPNGVTALDVAQWLAVAAHATPHPQASDDLEAWWHAQDCSILASNTGLVPFLDDCVLLAERDRAETLLDDALRGREGYVQRL
ncbi:MAG: hypothetical protein R3B48_26855 [Kofleriaceae bacterium]